MTFSYNLTVIIVKKLEMASCFFFLFLIFLTLFNWILPPKCFNFLVSLRQIPEGWKKKWRQSRAHLSEISGIPIWMIGRLIDSNTYESDKLSLNLPLPSSSLILSNSLCHLVVDSDLQYSNLPCKWWVPCIVLLIIGKKKKKSLSFITLLWKRTKN